MQNKYFFKLHQNSKIVENIIENFEWFIFSNVLISTLKHND